MGRNGRHERRLRPWLTMDPITQIFQQAGLSGPSSAIAAGNAFTQSFNQARQLRSQERTNERELALRERQIANQENYQREELGFARLREGRAQEQFDYDKSLRPQLEQARELGLKSAMLDFQLKQLQQQRSVQIQQGEAEATSILNDAAHIGFDDYTVAARIDNLMRTNPAALGGTEAGKALLGNLVQSAKLKSTYGGLLNRGLGGQVPARVTINSEGGVTTVFEAPDPLAQQRIDLDKQGVALRAAELKLRADNVAAQLPPNLRVQFQGLMNAIQNEPLAGEDTGAMMKKMNDTAEAFFKFHKIALPTQIIGSSDRSTNAPAIDSKDPLGLFK